MADFINIQQTEATYLRREIYTNSATPFALLSMPLQLGEGGRVILDVVASDDGGNKAQFYWLATVNRTLAGVTSVSAFTKLLTTQPTPMNTCTLTATTAGDTVNFNVVGVAGRNIVWSLVPDINTTLYIP